VAILSVSEFEAVVSQAIIKIDKHMVANGESPMLKQAKRDLQKVETAARDSGKLKALRDKLDATSDVVRVQISADEQLRNDLWDLVDYIDYRC
jgi:hypothetical protein